MTKETATPASGVVLGRYRVESELGRGGMGVVYACMDEPLKRRVAVKTLSAGLLGRDREARMMRFQREVKALSQLDHAGILHIYDAGEADDPVIGWVLYYAMELIEGETLSERLIRCGAMEAGAACSIVAKCGEALGSAHERGIVHRDVKPANIFIARRGRVVVADFGVCKIEGGTEITRKDQMVGTPSYLAPEQILGLHVDARTDVFALGALLYVLITNSALRPQLDRAGLSKLAATDDAAMRARAMRNVPAGLPEIVARALSRDPANRYADGTALAEALEAFCGRVPEPFEGPEAPPATPRPALGGNTSSSAFTDGGGMTNPTDAGPPSAQVSAVVGGDTAIDMAPPAPTEIQSEPPADMVPDLVADGGIRPALSPANGTPTATPRPVKELSGRRTRELEPDVRPVDPVEDMATMAGNPAAPTPHDDGPTAAPLPDSSASEPGEEPTEPPAARTLPPAIVALQRGGAQLLALSIAGIGRGIRKLLDLPRHIQAVVASALVVLMSAVTALVVVAARPAPPPPAPAAAPVPAPAPAKPPPPEGCAPAADADAKEATSLVDKAAAYEKKGDIKRALPLYEKAAKADPLAWEAHEGVARLATRAGQLDKARAHWACVAHLRDGEPEGETARKELNAARR